MVWTDYLLALPITLLTLFALGILLIDLMLPKEMKWANAITAFIGVLFSAAGVYKIQLWMAASPGSLGMMRTLLVDRFAIYFFYLFLAATAIAILMSVRYLEIENENHGEYYALMLLSVAGMMCMAAGFDIVLIFIGLELMAISTYVLVGFLRRDRRSNEAALKYLLLGAFSSGIFAYGLSLLYGLAGSTSLPVINQQLTRSMADPQYKPVAIIALVTTITGLLFKIAAIPFHQWAPDAYEGAPTSITGFMSVAVKAAGWAMLLRILLIGLMPMRPIWVPLLVFVSIATMTGANFAALTQTNTKRLLAYSSIAHVGYMLLGLIAGTATQINADGIKGILIYLLVYTFMNLGAFGVITALRHRNVIGDELDDLNGLYSRAPVEAVLMLIFLLSLAGIPPLAGFWGKYFIFLGLISTGHYALASLGVLYSVFGLYYYLKIANAMFMGKAEKAEETLPISLPMRAAIAVAGIATLYIGLLPNSFIELVNWTLGITRT
ncbi:MAG: NADH-quinone oxidoreductase subunit N [Acidobacteria bacterium]|nr:MAG: NADH-quinone oxidoreductase subunit N [Acidobacteriota bacterium]